MRYVVRRVVGAWSVHWHCQCLSTPTGMSMSTVLEAHSSLSMIDGDDECLTDDDRECDGDSMTIIYCVMKN